MAKVHRTVTEERARRWTLGLVVFLFLVGHFLLRPLLLSWSVAPDLLAGGVLLAALHARPGAAAGVGFGAGLLEGAMALEGMGALAALFAGAGYVAARARELFFGDSPLFLPVFVFIGVWALRVAEVLVTGTTLGWTAWLLRAPASAALTTVLVVMADRVVTPRP